MWGRQHIFIRRFSTFVCPFGPYSTNTTAMIKRIGTQPHCFISVVGPAGSGRTRLIGRMIVNQEKIFAPGFDKIIYFYKQYHQYYGTILVDCQSKHVDIDINQGLEWNWLQEAGARKRRILLVLDDMFDEAAPSKFLGTSSCWSTSQGPFDGFAPSLNSTDQKFKDNQFEPHTDTFFNNPRDSEQICVLGHQLGERHATIEAYNRATQKPFGHLMIDLDVRSSKPLRYSSNCSGDVPSIFYSSMDQLCLHLDNEFTKLLYNCFVYWLYCYTQKMPHLELLW